MCHALVVAMLPPTQPKQVAAAAQQCTIGYSKLISMHADHGWLCWHHVICFPTELQLGPAIRSVLLGRAAHDQLGAVVAAAGSCGRVAPLLTAHLEWLR
jgi:hypothetical protein